MEIDEQTKKMLLRLRENSFRLELELGRREAMRRPEYFPVDYTDEQMLLRIEGDKKNGLYMQYPSECK